MGGRGTFASGISVAYTYATIDTIEGIKFSGKSIQQKAVHFLKKLTPATHIFS